jgi:hypothetical protein
VGCSSLVVQVVISPPVPRTIEETQRVYPLYNARVLSPCRNPSSTFVFTRNSVLDNTFAYLGNPISA